MGRLLVVLIVVVVFLAGCGGPGPAGSNDNEIGNKELPAAEESTSSPDFGFGAHEPLEPPPPPPAFP